MRTSKPIATISYNSQEFLVHQLELLIKNHKISDYIFINHFAEADEKKNHIHLWIKPNTLLDTMDLQKHFTELDPKNPTKPFKCIDFRISQVDDWILYNQHYAQSLKSIKFLSAYSSSEQSESIFWMQKSSKCNPT